jgi:hypothetical protein
MLARSGSLIRITAIAVIVVFPTALVAADCDESKAQGENDAANRYSTAGWFIGGLGCGMLGGLIGAGVITAVAAFSNPQPKTIPDGFNESCYGNGYSGKAKSKRTWAALGGGLLGTLVFVAVYSAATAD